MSNYSTLAQSSINMPLLRYLIGTFCLVLTACGPTLPPEVAASYEHLPATIDFNFHVRPILSEHCFSCHGPDEGKRKAGLRLDLPEEAYKVLAESNQTAISPHDLEASESYHRLISIDPAFQMPPPEAKIPLSNEQKAILVKWIEQGAEYKDHWAFVKPEKPELPTLSSTEWAKNEIDHFVQQRLTQEKIEPAERASKETLIRRVAFDVTGLPPSLEQVDDYLADESPDAYQKILDQFLHSEAYGERMAAYWMEVARYADSDGYLDDKHRDFSPWRDWVIKAFNENMPYDSFVSLQVAGDLLPNATMEQILPTAFNRLNKKNSEAGIDLEEFRVEYVADKAHTFAKAFLGLTLECARCHSHKYDPISQEDYYSMFAFFNQTSEIGHAVYGPDITPGPALLLTDEEAKKKLTFLQKKIQEGEAAGRKIQEDVALIIQDNISLVTAGKIKKKLAQKQVAYYPFDQIRPDKKTFSSPNKANSRTPATLYEPVLKDGYKGKALFNTDYSTTYLGKKVGWFERTQAFSIDFYLYPDTMYEDASVFIHAEDWRLGNKGYSLYLKNNHLQFLMAHAFPQNAIQLKTKEALPQKKWSHVSLTYDGSSKAAGLNMYIDGKKADIEIEVDNLYKGILYVPNIHTYGFRGFQLGKRDGVLPMDGGGIDELRIFSDALTELEVLYLHEENTVKEILLDLPSHLSLIRDWEIKQHPMTVENSRSLQQSRDALNELVNEIPEIMVMKDQEELRPSFVLNRGVYDDRGKEVYANTPNSVLPFPENLPNNRLGLAKWLFHPENPLTARVMVNRIWEMHFGQGLVKTQEDFGNQGALPTHPGLLDWLAIWFQENDWDIKGLHKLIMSSATYQQSSKISKESLEKDPENKLLARGARFRLSAEMIRDNALALSGLLVPKIGGPSVYPYQPEGLWDEISNKHWRYPYLQKPGEGLYRRSLYTVWKRTAPPPAMLLLDANDRSGCTVQRTNTSTPLQALLLLNDPQYLEAARVLAENTLLQFKESEDQLKHVFRSTTGRRPDAKELETIQLLFDKEKNHFDEQVEEAKAYVDIGEKEVKEGINPVECAALAVVANAIMNTDEGYTRK